MNNEARSCSHNCHCMAMSIECSECVFLSLLIHHANHISCVALYCYLLPVFAVRYLSTLSHKRHDFLKRNYRSHKVCFDFLYNFYLRHC